MQFSGYNVQWLCSCNKVVLLQGGVDVVLVELPCSLAGLFRNCC